MNSVFQATDTVELCGLTIKQEILDPMSLFSQNDRIQHFMPVSLYKIEFCGVQKKKGKLVFSKRGVFQACHILLSVAQKRIK